MAHTHSSHDGGGKGRVSSASVSTTTFRDIDGYRSACTFMLFYLSTINIGFKIHNTKCLVLKCTIVDTDRTASLLLSRVRDLYVTIF